MMLMTAFPIIGIVLSLGYAGLVFIGVPWAIFAIVHTRRTTEEILAVQREILRQVRRAAKDPLADEPQRDDVARPPKRPFW